MLTAGGHQDILLPQGPLRFACRPQAIGGGLESGEVRFAAVAVFDGKRDLRQTTQFATVRLTGACFAAPMLLGRKCALLTTRACFCKSYEAEVNLLFGKLGVLTRAAFVMWLTAAIVQM